MSHWQSLAGKMGTAIVHSCWYETVQWNCSRSSSSLRNNSFCFELADIACRTTEIKLLLTFNAFMSLWNSFSQNLANVVNIALSLTVPPSLLSSHSDMGSLADFSKVHLASEIFPSLLPTTADLSACTAEATLEMQALKIRLNTIYTANDVIAIWIIGIINLICLLNQTMKNYNFKYL